MNSNFVGCSTGKIGGLGTLEDLVHINGRPAVLRQGVRIVGHKPAGFYAFSTERINDGNRLFNAKPAIR